MNYDIYAESGSDRNATMVYIQGIQVAEVNNASIAGTKVLRM